MMRLHPLLLLFVWSLSPLAARGDTKAEIEIGTQTRRDIAFVRRGARELRLHLIRPATLPRLRMPILIWVHGGLWRSGDAGKMPPLLFALARSGYGVASVEFRPSGEAVFPAQLDDLRAATRFLRFNARSYSLDGSKIGVAGISTGGHLASLLALRGGAGCAISLCGPSDLLTLEQGSRLGWNREGGALFALLGGAASEKPALARAASPLFCIAKNPPPFLLLHGEDDSLVALAQSEALFERLAAAGGAVTYRIYRGEEHGLRGAKPETESEILLFLAKWLPR